jgi:hypothetical protein
VFHAKYNLENGSPPGQDRGFVMVSTDGQNWMPASFRNGDPAACFGSEKNWTRREVDLTPFAGQAVYVAFVMASNGSVMGDSPGPAGFWVDDISVSSGYAETGPSIAGTTVTDYSVVGSVPGRPQLGCGVLAPSNVARVHYRLDCAPLGQDGPEDVEADSDTAPFTVAPGLQIPAVHNQIAQLLVECFDAAGNAGVVHTVPVWIFNQRGDANADGVVDQADVDAYAGKVGLTRTEAGYSPFFDTDLDGVITEADAAAAGYFWGSRLP